MDNIENAKTEAEEVKVAMLEKADEIKNVNQKAEKPQCARKNGKDSAAKHRRNQKMEFLRANKGLVFIVLISAAIIFAVVVSMLVTRETHEHSHSKVHNATHIP